MLIRRAGLGRGTPVADPERGTPSTAAGERAGRSAFGALLRQWRTTRRLSQLDLALSADVSSRHVSFLETGRAQPSRQMVALLCGALDVPLRERNALLQAAGFAPSYRETPLGDPEMEAVRGALELLLKRHDPFPAVAMDRHWNLVMANAPYLAGLSQVLGRPVAEPLSVVPEPRPNLLRLLFDPAALKPLVLNWEQVAGAVLARVHREASASVDPVARRLLEELVASPGVPPRSEWLDPRRAPALVIPVEVASPAGPLRYFTTLTTLGAAQDITLHELRIEAYHPADSATAELVHRLNGS